nr:immunoglobulin heavy chain junction region [Mus musculus]
YIFLCKMDYYGSSYGLL